MRLVGEKHHPSPRPSDEKCDALPTELSEVLQSHGARALLDGSSIDGTGSLWSPGAGASSEVTASIIYRQHALTHKNVDFSGV